MQIEEVVLVNEQNEVLGTTPKHLVHSSQTLLHRGFSCFIFNDHGQVLIQRRSSDKKTWPLAWSNSCCGHPLLNESNTDAAIRRARFELGMEITEVKEVAPYRYCFTKEGVMENEICPILIAKAASTPAPNSEEVDQIDWLAWSEFLNLIKNNPEFSPWCKEESLILDNLPEFVSFYEQFSTQ